MTFAVFHSCKWFPILNSCKMVPQGSGSRLVESVLDFCLHSDWLAPKYWDLLDGDGLPVDLSLCKPLPTPLPPQRLHLEPHTHPSGLTVLCWLFSTQIFFFCQTLCGFHYTSQMFTTLFVFKKYFSIYKITHNISHLMLCNYLHTIRYIMHCDLHMIIYTNNILIWPVLV